MIENAGHCANMDESETFNRVVLGFIKSQMEVYLGCNQEFKK